MKKILFITGTRADYGKIKPLIKKVEDSGNFTYRIFVTGMHLLSKYGDTYIEIEKDGFTNIFKYINQHEGTKMDISLSNTISGLSNYLSEWRPDFIVIHGDRLEALAGAIVGAFNNILVGHIEGGEVSGTIDESIRHAVTKFSHLHFTSNEEAKKRIIQLGENEKNIYIIGSPDIDIMYSRELPSLEAAKKKYSIDFDEYSILIYHPVTTSLENLASEIDHICDSVLESKLNYIVIYPNNDQGSNIIIQALENLSRSPQIRLFPSIKFEYFLTFLKHCQFIIGNSSSGIREAGIYGIPAIDIGERQKDRYSSNDKHVIHIEHDISNITRSIQYALTYEPPKSESFGTGKSAENFIKILDNDRIWETRIQKYFIDVI